MKKLKSRNRDGRYLSIQHSLCLAAECHRRLQLHVRLLLSAHLILEIVHTKESKNHGEQDKTSKNNIELVIANKDPPKAFDSSKETLDLVSAFVEYPVILPWIDAILLRRNDRIVTQLLGYSAHFISLIRAIHEKRLSNTAGRGKK